jgi:hypothetical protein
LSLSIVDWILSTSFSSCFWRSCKAFESFFLSSGLNFLMSTHFATKSHIVCPFDLAIRILPHISRVNQVDFIESYTSLRQRGENGVRPSCSFSPAAPRPATPSLSSRQLERLVRSDARFAAKAMVLNAASDEACVGLGWHWCSSTPERRDHLLTHLVAVAPALDDLQIGTPGRGLAAEVHGGSACWCANRVRFARKTQLKQPKNEALS